MEQAAILQQPLQFHGTAYNVHADHDCLDQYTGHAHHFQAVGTNSVEQFRRESALPHPTASSYNLAAHGHASGVRAGAERWAGVSDASSYQTPRLTDSSSASFSTSPSSAASSTHPYTTFPQNAYTALPTFAGAVTLPQAFVQSSFPSARIPEPATATPSSLTPLARPPLPTDAPHRDAYAAAGIPYVSQLTQSLYPTYHDTSRSYVSALPNGITYPSNMTSSNGYGQSGSTGECLNFPWPDLECLLDLTCEGQAVTPNIYAKVEKGFFLSTTDQKWTCYRRNYFSVQCHFDLTPNIVNGRLFLKRNNNASEQVQAMGVRLAAAVDGSKGKSIELIQHTPKRDAGPKTKIEIVKVAPTAGSRADHSLSPNGIYQVPMAVFHATGVSQGPFLPLQNTVSVKSNTSTASPNPTISTFANGSYSNTATHGPLPSQYTTHTFERVQFKSATANNGKRRASQQYFHLIVELFADVRKSGAETPNWVKVAQRVSDKIVVRGRSPSHYQNEGQHGSTGRSSGSSAGSGGGYDALYGSGTAYSSTAGAFRSATGLGGFGGSGSSDGYRGGNVYCMRSSSAGSREGDSSPGSIDEETIDEDEPFVGADTAMTDGSAKCDPNSSGVIQGYDGYRCYPGTIYESIQLPLPPLGRVEGAGLSGSGGTRSITDPRQYTVKAEHVDATSGAQWAGGSCGRFEGMPTSHGCFPDLPAGFS